MSDKKINVFPNKNNDETPEKYDYEKEKITEVNKTYSNSISSNDLSSAYIKAIEEMQKKTNDQLLNEKERTYTLITAKNESITLDYNKKDTETIKQNKIINMNQNKIDDKEKIELLEEYIQKLSEPNFECPFDLLPLPSEGLLYGLKKDTIKVAFMTTTDESILLSPNLLNGGKFIEVLINRKVIDTDLRYKRLHIGDRNAILIWLRATSYGHEYPVTLLDEDGNPFDTIIDLSQLKTKKLGAKPDAEGLFDFTFPLAKQKIKFKLLNCGEMDEIEFKVAEEIKNGCPIDNTSTYILQKSVIEVDGDRDIDHIRNVTTNLRLKDAQALSDYIEKIESGIDLKITVETPRGGSIETFLPLNANFFWPNGRI